MSVRIKVEYIPDACGDAGKLREILCAVAKQPPEAGWNPLIATDFNERLQAAVQQAFDEGRAFEKLHPSLA